MQWKPLLMLAYAYGSYGLWKSSKHLILKIFLLTFSLTLTLKRGRTIKILSLFCISFISGHLFYTWIENTTVTFHVLCLSFVFSLLSGNIQMTAISRNKRGWYLKKKYASDLTSFWKQLFLQRNSISFIFSLCIWFKHVK